MATIYTIAVVLGATTFLLWYSRAYKNILALGAHNRRWGPRWAVVYWFIPIVNLFRPKQVMNDIWRGSDPDLPRQASEWHSRPVAALVHWWWAASLISGFIGNRVVRAAFDAEATAPELRDQAMGYVIVDFTEMIAPVLAIVVVARVTRRQKERMARHEARSAPDAVPAPAEAG